RLNPDVTQGEHFAIAANTDATLTVVTPNENGVAFASVASAGATYAAEHRFDPLTLRRGASRGGRPSDGGRHAVDRGGVAATAPGDEAQLRGGARRGGRPGGDRRDERDRRDGPGLRGWPGDGRAGHDGRERAGAGAAARRQPRRPRRPRPGGVGGPGAD